MTLIHLDLTLWSPWEYSQHAIKVNLGEIISVTVN